MLSTSITKSYSRKQDKNCLLSRNKNVIKVSKSQVLNIRVLVFFGSLFLTIKTDNFISQGHNEPQDKPRIRQNVHVKC